MPRPMATSCVSLTLTSLNSHLTSDVITNNCSSRASVIHRCQSTILEEKELKILILEEKELKMEKELTRGERVKDIITRGERVKDITAGVNRTLPSEMRPPL